MCTYCGQHCVEDDIFRLSKKEIESGKKKPENICPDKHEEILKACGIGADDG